MPPLVTEGSFPDTSGESLAPTGDPQSLSTSSPQTEEPGEGVSSPSPSPDLPSSPTTPQVVESTTTTTTTTTPTTTTTVGTTTATPLPCEKREVDLAFLLDASASEGNSNFRTQLDFVKNFVSYMDVGPHAMQIGLVTFDTNVHRQFFLNQYDDSASVISALGHVPYTSGTTYTQRALAYMRTSFFTPNNGARAGVPKVLVLLTDGQSTSPSQTEQEGAMLKQTGVHVIAVGIGSSLGMRELNAIASNKESVLTVSSFSSLLTHVDTIKTSFCHYCGGKRADIVFVLDASYSEGESNFKKQLSFVSNVTAQLYVSPTETQVSLLTFSSSVHNQFYLNTHTSKYSVLNALKHVPFQVGATYTGKALQFVRTNSLSANHGRRPNSQPIVIVLTDGQSSDRSETVQEASLLKGTGALVIAVGIGRDADQYELRHIATDTAHVFTVQNFDFLSAIQQQVLNEACAGCGTKPADIVFLMDSSSSEATRDFSRMKEFVSNFSQQFQLGPQNVQIAAVSFSTTAHVAFYLNTFASQATLQNGIARISYYGGNTHTDLALSAARNAVFTKTHGARDDATKTAILMTDGQSLNTRATELQAQMLKQMGATVITVGVGSSVNHNELESVASDIQHSFAVASFSALQSIQHELVQTACKVCSGDESADILLILDTSTEAAQTNFIREVTFATRLINDFTVGPDKVQFALLTYASLPNAEFWFNSYTDRREMFFAMQTLQPASGSNNLGGALRAHQLKQEGVTVMAVGVGDDVSKAELTAVASDPSGVFLVSDFSALNDLHKNVQFIICSETRNTVRAAHDTSTSRGPEEQENTKHFQGNGSGGTTGSLDSRESNPTFTMNVELQEESVNNTTVSNTDHVTPSSQNSHDSTRTPHSAGDSQAENVSIHTVFQSTRADSSAFPPQDVPWNDSITLTTNDVLRCLQSKETPLFKHTAGQISFSRESFNKNESCVMEFVAPVGMVIQMLVFLNKTPCLDKCYFKPCADYSLSLFDMPALFAKLFSCEPKFQRVVSFRNRLKFLLVAYTTNVSIDLSINFTAVQPPQLQIIYITPTTGYVQSPDWDGKVNYPSHLDIWTRLPVPSNNSVMISFRALDIDGGKVCAYDHLTIYVGEHTTGGESTELTYCNNQPSLPPTVFHTNALRFHFITDDTKERLGFRLYFSFHNQSEIPEKLEDGKWNCSVSYWPKLQLHLNCNKVDECFGKEDENHCGYADHGCGKGFFAAGSGCYTFISGEKTVTWNEAANECRLRESYLASLNTPEEWQDVIAAVKDLVLGPVYFGLQIAGVSFPGLYHDGFQWADGSAVYYANIYNEYEHGVTRGCSVLVRRNWYANKDFLSTAECNRNLSNSFLCEKNVPPKDDPQNKPRDIVLHPLQWHRQGDKYVPCPSGHGSLRMLACDPQAACWAGDADGSHTACRYPASPPPPSLQCVGGGGLCALHPGLRPPGGLQRQQ
ncbi:hypothetical protein ACOMHN_025792 [Nucella lapillus]